MAYGISKLANPIKVLNFPNQRTNLDLINHILDTGAHIKYLEQFSVPVLDCNERERVKKAYVKHVCPNSKINLAYLEFKHIQG